jgi:hypothetical protein
MNMEISNTTLKNNLDSLTLSEQLKKELLTMPLSSDVQISMMAKGKPRMRYKSCDLYNTEDPLGTIVKEIQRLKGEKQQDLVVLFGFALGIHAEFIKKKFDSKLLIFDPFKEIFKTVLTARTIQLQNTIIENNYGRLFDLLDKYLENSDRKLVVTSIPAYRECFAEEFERFKSVVQQAVDNLSIRQNTLQKGMQWAEHELTNLKNAVLLPDVAIFKNKFKGRPAIFAGSGPSLDKNIKYLKSAQNKAVIIAANSALKALDKHGIVPDFAAVIEAKDLTYHFRETTFLKELNIVATPNAFPGYFKLPCRHTFCQTVYPSPTNDWLQQAYDCKSPVTAGGSVALTAFAILYKLGCNPIIAIGMDLAYTEGSTHAADSDYSIVKMKYDRDKKQMELYVDPDDEKKGNKKIPENAPKKEARAALLTEAWGDRSKKVVTYTVFNSYRLWLESAAETWASDRTLINCTEGGAHIKGFNEKYLKDTIDQFCVEHFPAREWIDSAVAEFKPPEIKPIQKVAHDELQKLSQMSLLAQKAAKQCRQAISEAKKYNLQAAQNHMNRLEKKEAELGALTRKSRLLNQVLQSAANKIRLERHKDKNSDQVKQTINSLNRSILLFDEIITAADKLKKLIKKNINYLIN